VQAYAATAEKRQDFREETMARKYIDCREFPSEMKCTVAISADREDELIEAAVQHAVSVHGEHDTPQFRSEIRKAIHEGAPAA
jgi:predicted small metal-binding protein